MPVTRLVVPSAVPYGSDGMDDFLAGQSVRSGHLALAGPASAQRAAFLQQFFTRSAVYGSVHTPASQQGTVRGVYYGIHLQLRDVSHDLFLSGLSCLVTHGLLQCSKNSQNIRERKYVFGKDCKIFAMGYFFA